MEHLFLSDPFWRYVAVGGDDDCWLYTGGSTGDGYGSHARGRAHRVAYEIANGVRLLPTQIICHTCDSPRCCNPNHLRVGTHADNVADRVRRDRSAKGAANGRSKLTESQVLRIFKSSEQPQWLALRYGVDRTAIRDIQRGITWAWLTKGAA